MVFETQNQSTYRRILDARVLVSPSQSWPAPSSRETVAIE